MGLHKITKTLIFNFAFLFFVLSVCFAENFRVNQMQSINVETNTKSTTVQCGINDGVLISFPEDKTYIQGIELEVKIPKLIASYRDSVVYYIFDSIIQNRNSAIDFSGKRLFADVIPSRLSYNAQLFFDEVPESKQKATPYSAIMPFTIESETTSNIAIKFQLAMKGVPETFFDSFFDVTIKPIIKDEGTFLLNLVYDKTEEEKPVFVYIDEELVDSPFETIMLKSGIHYLSVISENYRNEVRTFNINQAANNFLEVELKSIQPEVNLLAPENTEVYFDSELIEDLTKTIVTTEGEHVISFKLNGFESTKTINIQNGKTYNIALSIDISVQEY